MRDAMPSLLEVDDDLDVAGPAFQRLAPALERNAARDHASEPILVGARQRIGRHLIVPAVGVDAAEHDVVVEHERAVEAADIDFEFITWLGDTGETKDA